MEKSNSSNKKLGKTTNYITNNGGITLIALIVIIIVDLVSYDKNRKYSNLVGFSL